MVERKVELLAPAGDRETLEIAVNAGADAVYVGGAKFSARAHAPNFTEEELLDAIDFMHLRGKKLYLAVNTLVKEREFEELYRYILPYYMQGLDAVIVQDLGVFDYIKKQFPDLAVHASTQMTVTHKLAAEYLKHLGASRIVLARELSLEEIRDIAGNIRMEIECFVHGALCYSYSGQCLLSSMIGGRSGNRGQCAQPCRLSYRVGEETQLREIMSLKDLCTVEYIPELIEAGIASFKIEGRMKQPSYVAAVTSVYRKYIDLYMKKGREGFRVSREDLEGLWKAYQRRGYCSGYYYRRNGRKMLSLGKIDGKDATEQNLPKEKKQEKIKGKLIVSPDECVKLLLEYRGVSAAVTGVRAEAAQNQPMTAKRLKEQMLRTGNTPFVFDKLDIVLDGKVFLPIQGLNELRRRGLKQLELQILKNYRRQKPDEIRGKTQAGYKAVSLQGDAPEGILKFSVLVETFEQFEAVLHSPYVERIYVEDAIFLSDSSAREMEGCAARAHDRGKEVYFAMARVFREQAFSVYERMPAEFYDLFDGVLVRNLESFFYLRGRGYERPVAADANLYQWNRMAKEFVRLEGIEESTAPVELHFKELKELGIEQMELVVYGFLPVMVTAGCVRRNTKGCAHISGSLVLTDRRRKRFMVKNNCNYCYNVIYNSAPLMLADQKKEVESLNAKRLRLQFTAEKAEQVKEILALYGDIFINGRERKMPNTDFTRGHFKRGVK